MMKFSLAKATLVGGVAATLAMGAAASSVQAAEGRNAAAIAGAVGGLAVGSALAGGGYAAPPARVVRERRVIVEDEADDEVCEVQVRRTYVDGVGYRTRRVRVCE
jgi:hypothetical protein